MWDAIQFVGTFVVSLTVLLFIYYHAQRLVKQKFGSGVIK